MAVKVLLLLALVTTAAAEGQSHEDSYESHEEPKYEFSYKVQDYHGNDFGHEEKRDGDNTEGSYYNNLPDGRLQKVNYYVNGYSGYVADVNYEGEAHYDSGSSHSRSREVRESSRPPHFASRGSSASRFTFGSHESQKSDESRFSSRSLESREPYRFSFRSHESGDSRRVGQESKESKEKKDDTNSSKSDKSRSNSRSHELPESHRFYIGSYESGEYHRVSQESKESTQDDTKSSESREHHRPVYYQPIFDSRETASIYDADSDEDDDFLTSSEFFIANYRPQIRYQPS